MRLRRRVKGRDRRVCSASSLPPDLLPLSRGGACETHPPPRHGQVQRGAEEQAPVESGPQARRAWGARHRQAEAADRARLRVRQAEAQARASPQPGRPGGLILRDFVCWGAKVWASLMTVSGGFGVQEQKEAAMIKALENNMGDVDMVSAEGAIVVMLHASLFR